MAQINRLINAKKKQIALLQEQKRAVINAAVKKSSEGWERKSLKYWVNSNLTSLSSNTDPDLEIDYLDISAVGHGYIKQEPVHLTFREAPSRARRVVKYGDTIISTVRTYLRSVCFIDHAYEHCIVSTGFSVLSPNKNVVLPELLSFVLSSDEFIDDVIKNSIGVSYPAINDSKLLSLKISLPLSIEEQELLYKSIKEKFDVFDNLIEKIKSQVFLLHEYRTRLVSDVVTGKLDVSGVVVPQYEVVEEIAENDPMDDIEEEIDE
ncbi:restriction endonuclease subunit S [Cohnella ginsengisoli]|uniref:Restriction endonuclease subunit S n=1 Tax=Cohnella ginsengisoli TaxID=425004 RepID=A0A9X4QMP0_9BACL|nr:restriction endonuclease subunit S [Cohnella ginsengisoli]MDG0792259.1 restriction endonuclease subunit S [Cohnella ginsengisoli]